MATLNAEEIKKLKRGELIGHIFAGVSAAALIYFAVCFTVAQVMDLPALRLSTLICAPIILALSAAVSAYCNLKFGGQIDKLTEAYVREVFVENAALMHPEKEILSFYFSYEGSSVISKVNKFKEEILFDFSAFGKLTAARRSGISSAIVTRLCTTFLRLYERGAKYKTVSYAVRASGKEGKSVYIILDGEPDKKAYRAYLRTK